MYHCAMRIITEKTEYVSLSCGCPAKAPAVGNAVHMLKGFNQRELPVIRWFPFFMGTGIDPTDLKAFGAPVSQTGKAKNVPCGLHALVPTLKRNRVSIHAGNSGSLPSSRHNNEPWYYGEAGLGEPR